MHRALVSLFAVALCATAETPVRVWKARWISVAPASQTAYGVYHFRRAFDLATVPARFPVHVSADNRYELFVNGVRVSTGPARGDLLHWRYETVDIAPQLKPGRNTLAAVVWNWGEDGPLSQLTAGTGFILQADDTSAGIDTGKTWRAIADTAYRALPIRPVDIGYQYYVAPPGERFDARRHHWGWEAAGFDDSKWGPASVGDIGCSRDWTKDEVPGDCHDYRMLVPRTIPQMTAQPVEFARVRLAEGVASQFPATIPPKTRARILLDMNRIVTAYPEFAVSGGSESMVRVMYAETLRLPGKQAKGHRDQVEGKEIRGLVDEFIPDGAARTLRPLWWRTFRYVELDIQTTGEPLTIGARAVLSTYPFERRAKFESDAPAWFNRVLDVGWWTNLLSSNETFIDAYYEQMQYVADSRIEALVSLYEAGDPRLMRNAIEQLDSTRTPDGLTYSRAPSRLYQYSPAFSLLWIGMLHDYWRYVDDPEFVRAMLPGTRAVLGWFARLQRNDALLGSLPYYNFLDSNFAWKSDALGAYELQLAMAYREAADMEAALGDGAAAAAHRKAADRLANAVKSRYWDGARRLFADDAGHTRYSQHMNAMAILAGLAQGAEARALMERTLADRSLTPTTIYFSYYLHRALVAAGLGDRYLDQLGTWRKLLDLGVTAWPESEDPNSRSDCHGWGDHPNIEAYRTILGIDSAASGFARLRIEPHLGALKEASGSIPHPRGTVSVSIKRTGASGAAVEIETPVAGNFIWNNETRPFNSGKTRLEF